MLFSALSCSLTLFCAFSAPPCYFLLSPALFRFVVIFFPLSRALFLAFQRSFHTHTLVIPRSSLALPSLFPRSFIALPLVSPLALPLVFDRCFLAVVCSGFPLTHEMRKGENFLQSRCLDLRQTTHSKELSSCIFKVATR